MWMCTDKMLFSVISTYSKRNLSCPIHGFGYILAFPSSLIVCQRYGDVTETFCLPEKSRRRVSWVSEGGQGFSLEYPAISLHAVSKDLASFPHEHLYLMIDGNLNEEENLSDEDEGNDDDPMSEVRFIPADKTSLELMYRAMCDCQALHPDAEQDCLSDEDDFYGDENGQAELTEEGQARLQHLENIFNAGDSGFMEGEPVVGRPSRNGGGEEGMETGEPMEQGQFEDAE